MFIHPRLPPAFADVHLSSTIIVHPSSAVIHPSSPAAVVGLPCTVVCLSSIVERCPHHPQSSCSVAVSRLWQLVQEVGMGGRMSPFVIVVCSPSLSFAHHRAHHSHPVALAEHISMGPSHTMLCPTGSLSLACWCLSSLCFPCHACWHQGPLRASNVPAMSYEWVRVCKY